MKIQTEARIEAPPDIVFRFFRALDHLRFTSVERRKEWCPQLGLQLEEGKTYEVRLTQGRHELTLRIRSTRVEPDALLEESFVSWPVRGGSHRQTFTASEDGASTIVVEINEWSPPWFARRIVERHEAEQTEIFAKRLDRAKSFIERAHAERGPEAFAQGIFAEAERLGLEPMISPEA